MGDTGNSADQLRGAAREAVLDLVQRSFARAADAPLVAGNAVRILRDSTENWPAWEAAIAGAKRHVHVEMYIVGNDDVGRRFVSALAERARAGVSVRVLIDWFGSLPAWLLRRLRPIVDAGGHVSVSSAPRLASLLGVLQRDHRKVITVDGRIAFVSGLCVAAAWQGDAAKGIPPWRDTGLALEGPAVADVELAFARSWETFTGSALPAAETPRRDQVGFAGDVGVRVLATEPSAGSALRLDLLVASMARSRLWLTDAYFLGSGPYVRSLQQAARDGVDVRLLVPGTSDLPLVATMSRSLYRPLLDAGVRVFEWNGPMIHAKTAVADSQWTRVGSTNLNFASWIGNWELDVTIEDPAVARQMEQQYLADLENSTEIIASQLTAARGRLGREKAGFARRRRAHGMRTAMRRGAVGVAGQAIRLGSGLRGAVSGHRALDESTSAIPFVGGLALVAIAAAGMKWPLLVAIPVVLVSGLLGIGLTVQEIAARVAASRSDRGEAEADREDRDASR